MNLIQRTYLLLHVILLITASCTKSPVGESEQKGYVIQNVNVISMENDQVLAGQSVHIEGEKIAGIYPAENFHIPEGTTVIDGTGKYLMPGLSEMHAHIPVPKEDSTLVEETLFLYLSNGVTTIRGMLGDPFHLWLKDQVNNKGMLGPRIFTSGPSFSGNTVKTPGEAIARVLEQKEAGYDFLKLHPGIKREVFDALDSTAKAVDMEFSGHVSIDVGIQRALEAGYGTIDHLDGYVEGLVPVGAGVEPGDNGFFGFNFTDKVDESLIQGLVLSTINQGVWVVPTQSLLVRWTGPEDPESLGDQPEMKYMDKEVIGRWVQTKKDFQAAEGYDKEKAERFIAVRGKILKALSEAGAGLLLGSDAPQVFNVPGFSIQHELGAMAETGISNYEILKSGTVNPALYFGLEKDFGLVKKGYYADMILLEADPLANLANVREQAGVFVRGKWLTREYIESRLGEIARGHAR
ncbi:MAG: amidohydrolase family protein [Cyclobacteriaceae bacterium]|nr:amidohydrolase family protein [Cyclobacteriaceae bacterium]